MTSHSSFHLIRTRNKNSSETLICCWKQTAERRPCSHHREVRWTLINLYWALTEGEIKREPHWSLPTAESGPMRPRGHRWLHGGTLRDIVIGLFQGREDSRSNSDVSCWNSSWLFTPGRCFATKSAPLLFSLKLIYSSASRGNSDVSLLLWLFCCDA